MNLKITIIWNIHNLRFETSQSQQSKEAGLDQSVFSSPTTNWKEIELYNLLQESTTAYVTLATKVPATVIC